MTHNYDEFSLRLSWSPSLNGVTPAIPGFYLRATFANEAEVTGIVKNSGRAGNGSRVSGRFLLSLYELMAEEGLLEPWADSDDLGHALATFQEQRQTATLEAKRAHLDRLRAEVEALEREVGS